MSTLGWLDSSEHERRAVLELVAALREPGTLDELGIGSIRDTIADELFPGTSTIQTRARYFLFIPWILQRVEATSPRLAERHVRDLQLQLCGALDKAHGANAGVIGREAGAALQRWPLSIYWLGLARWGIRRNSWSIPYYFEALRRPSTWGLLGRAVEEDVEGRRDESADRDRGNWVGLPPPPPDFPRVASFALTVEEGQFLQERVAHSRPESYLAHILLLSRAEDGTTASMPWDHVAAETASVSVASWLHDARLFSLVHEGAALLYNRLLAEALDDQEHVDDFGHRLTQWSESVAAAEPDIRKWDRESMWDRLRRANPRLRWRTQEFADRWYGLAATQSGSTPVRWREARTLIRRARTRTEGFASAPHASGGA